jgi:hypothetical protein
MSFIKTPKRWKWKEFSRGQKVIAIFGFSLPLFWIIAYVHNIIMDSNDKIIYDKDMPLLFSLGHFHILMTVLGIAINIYT